MRPLAVLGTSVAAVVILAVTTSSQRAPRPFFGVSVPANAPAELAAVARAAGQVPSVDNVFVKLDSPSFTRDLLSSIGDAHQVPMVSLEPWSYRDTWGHTDLRQYSLARVAAGDWDTDLSRIAGTIASYGAPVYLRFAHEMNGWWYPWAVGENGNTAADYVAAWRHVVELIRQTGAEVRFVWSPNAVTGSPRESPLEAAYPGDDWVDLVGMTGYGHGPSASDTLDPTMTRLSRLTARPLVLAETGADGPDKAAWIDSLGPWLRAHSRVVGFVWFNTAPSTTGATGDYRITDDPGVAAAFRAMVDELF